MLHGCSYPFCTLLNKSHDPTCTTILGTQNSTTILLHATVAASATVLADMTAYALIWYNFLNHPQDSLHHPHTVILS